MTPRNLHPTLIRLLAAGAVCVSAFSLYATIIIHGSALKLAVGAPVTGFLAGIASVIVRAASDGDDDFNEPGVAGNVFARLFVLMIIFAAFTACTCIFAGSLRVYSLCFTALFALSGAWYLVAMWREEPSPAQ